MHEKYNVFLQLFTSPLCKKIDEIYLRNGKTIYNVTPGNHQRNDFVIFNKKQQKYILRLDEIVGVKYTVK